MAAPIDEKRSTSLQIGDGQPVPCNVFPFQRPRRIVIVGPMAAGKTSVAKRLAHMLDWQWLDTDRMVEDRAGKAVADIFADDGEDAFRQMEQQALRQALTAEKTVIATGGGIVLAAENRRMLADQSAVAALVAPPEFLAERLTALGQVTRPLLAVPDPAQRLARLWQERRAFYRQVADLWLDTRDLFADEVAELLAACFGLRPLTPRLPVGALPPQWHLTVGLDHTSYPIWIGPNLLAAAGELLPPTVQPRQALIVTDAAVDKLYGDKVAQALTAADIKCRRIVIPAGESSKTLAQMSRVLDAAVAGQLDRQDIFVAVGGGMVGDLTGFAAASYLRGVNWVQVPTTLLAQVDASVGGKTGVNHPQGKNLIGAFHQPVLVLADTSTLGSLPLGEWRSGLAEVVKHGFLSGGLYLDFIGQHGPVLRAGPDAPASPLQAALVAGSVAIKAAVVMADEREQNVRALLNLGHTLGHAIEAVAGYGQVRHGEAVAVGMGLAAALAQRLGLLPEHRRQQLLELVGRLGLPCSLDQLPVTLTSSQLLQAAHTDKKRRQGRLRWVLPTGTSEGLGGAVVRADVPPELVKQVLEQQGA